MNLNKTCLLNLSKEHRCFVWTLPKTGSSLATFIFRNFNFNSYRVDKEGNVFFSKNNFIHNHTYPLFPNHENYDLIITCRNPYNRIISSISNYLHHDRNTILDYIKKHTKNFLFNERVLENNLTVRKPNYLIKIESVSEDYEIIPFIRNSDFYKKGLLSESLKIKFRESIVKYDWKNYIDEEIADFIYQNCKTQFDFFGYDKNSWKS